MTDTPAYDQAEEGCVGSVLLDPQWLFPVAAIVQPSDFHDPALQTIFAAALAVAAGGKPVDSIVVMDHLKAIGQYDAVGGAAFVAKMFRIAPNAAHAIYYAEIIRDHARRRRQQLLARQVADMASAGDSPDDINATLQAHLEFDRARNIVGGFETLSCDDLEATSDEEYLVSGCIVRNQANMFGGPPKSFKTTAAVDMALSMATAGYFLGYFKCPRAVSVLFMSAESGLSTLRKTAKSIAKEAGIDWPNVPNLRFSTMLPKFGIDAEIKRLDATFKANPFDVLFIDPLYKCFGSTDSANMFAAGELLMHFGAWCEANGVTLVLLHHLKKSVANPYEPAELSDFSWAGFAEHARSWLLLSRREKYIPGTPHKLWLSIGGSAGHGGLWGLDINQGEFVPGELRDWDVKLQPAAELQREEAEKKAAAKNEVKLTTAQAKAQANVQTLLSTLKGFPEGETKTTLRTRSGLNTAAIDSAIFDALQSKQIEVCKVMKAGRKQGRDGYKIAQLEASGPSGPSGQNSQLSGCPDGGGIGTGLAPLLRGSPSPDAPLPNPDGCGSSVGTNETEAAA